MKKAIHIAIIILFLVAMCTTEQIISQTFLRDTRSKVDELFEISSSSEIINTEEISNKTDELEEFWRKRESILCTFINHREIEEIGVEISKLKSALREDEKHVFLESIMLIQFYLRSYQHVLGINFQSIF